MRPLALAAWLGLILFLGLALGAALPARADAVRADAPAGIIIIDNDDGGNIGTFLMWYARLRASGTPVHLRGICASACTFVLTLPPAQVCVEPTASLAFHLLQDGRSGRPLPEQTQATIRRYYPTAVQAWL